MSRSVAAYRSNRMKAKENKNGRTLWRHIRRIVCKAISRIIAHCNLSTHYSWSFQTSVIIERLLCLLGRMAKPWRKKFYKLTPKSKLEKEAPASNFRNLKVSFERRKSTRWFYEIQAEIRTVTSFLVMFATAQFRFWTRE